MSVKIKALIVLSNHNHVFDNDLFLIYLINHRVSNDQFKCFIGTYYLFSWSSDDFECRGTVL